MCLEKTITQDLPADYFEAHREAVAKSDGERRCVSSSAQHSAPSS